MYLQPDAVPETVDKGVTAVRDELLSQGVELDR